jgi:hypothetical protein
MAPDDISRVIESFTRDYVNAMNEALETRSEGISERFCGKIVSAATFEAADGYITFYFTSRKSGGARGPAPWFKKGIHVYHHFAKYDIDAIARGVSFGLVQVIRRPIGSAIAPLPAPREMGADLPDGVDVTFLTAEIVEALATALPGSAKMPIVIFSPRVNVEDGVVRSICAERFKLWSSEAVVDGRTVPLHAWAHVDIWSKPEELNIGSADPALAASTDLEVLRFLLSVGSSPARLDNQSATDQLLAMCNDFMALVEQDGSSEEALHQWLHQSSHHIFLDPDPVSVWSKIPFGNKVSDFVVKRSDGTYVLCEIEPATESIFIKNGEWSARFNHACTQVRDWQGYISRNMHTVEDELKFEGIGQPSGMVVIGRSSAIADGDASRRWAQRKQGDGSIRYVFTYDELCDRVRHLAARVRNLEAKR